MEKEVADKWVAALRRKALGTTVIDSPAQQRRAHMFEFKAGDTVSLTGIVSQVLMGPRYQISVKTSLGDDTVEVYAYPQVMTLVKARPIQVGDIVRHPNFGEDGFKVIAIDKDEAWAIRIKDGKRMTLWYASLEPVPPRGR